MQYRKDDLVLYSILGFVIFTLLIAELGLFLLSGGVYILITHLFYFPVVFAAFYYPRKGILLATLCAAAYLTAIYSIASPGTGVLAAATMQFYVFVSLGVVISVVSGDLKVNEMMYRNIFDHAGSAICLIDARSGTILETNRRCTWMAGVERPEGFLASLDQLLPSRVEREEFLRRLHSGEAISNYETVLILPDGTGRDLLVSAGLLPNEVIIMTLEDITGRKRDEATLRESERRFRELAELLPQPVFEFGRDGLFMFANRSAFAVFGYTPDGLQQGVHVLQTVVPEDRERAAAGIRRIMEGGERSHSAEYTALRTDGSTFPVIISSGSIDEDGRVTGVRGVIVDISERKRIEALDREHMRNLEFLSRTATELSEMTGDGDTYAYISDRLLEIFPGSSNVVSSIDDAVRRAQVRVVGGSDEFRNAMDEVRESRPEGLQFEIPPAGMASMLAGGVAEITGGVDESSFGQLSPYLCSRIGDALGGGRIYGIGFTWGGRLFAAALVCLPSGCDLHDRGVLTAFTHQASIALQRRVAEDELRDREAQYRTLFENSSDGILLMTEVFIDCNERALEMLGYSRDEVVGKRPEEISPAVQPDGTSSADRAREKTCAALAGTPQQFSWQHRRKDGTLVDTEVSLKALSLHGEIVLQASLRDVTERIRAEEAIRQINRKLHLLSSITRHDILNQITGIVGYLEILNESMPPDPEVQEYFQRIADLTKTIQRQITFTRDYEDLGLKAPLWQRLDDVVHAAAASLDPGAGITVRIDVGNAEIFADSMFEKVFFNLLENSLRHGETVSGIRVAFTVRNGRGVISVSDDGSGVPEAMKERIFQRGVGKNTGYGLFLVREVLSITGMSIREIGEEGSGACFEILIPEGVYRCD